MRHLFFLLSITFLLSSTPAWSTVYSGDCQVHFYGDSTLHGFEGTGTCEPFSWETRVDENDNPLIRNAVVRVPVRTMDTDNDSRDKKMFQMFAAEEHPLIRGRFGDFDPMAIVRQLKSADGAPGTLTFDLLIRDVVQPVNATVRDAQLTDGQLSFTAEFLVSLEDFKLKAPSVLGFIRVDDQVKVEVDVTVHGDNLSGASTNN